MSSTTDLKRINARLERIEALLTVLFLTQASKELAIMTTLADIADKARQIKDAVAPLGPAVAGVKAAVDGLEQKILDAGIDQTVAASIMGDLNEAAANLASAQAGINDALADAADGPEAAPAPETAPEPVTPPDEVV